MATLTDLDELDWTPGPPGAAGWHLVRTPRRSAWVAHVSQDGQVAVGFGADRMMLLFPGIESAPIPAPTPPASLGQILDLEARAEEARDAAARITVRIVDALQAGKIDRPTALDLLGVSEVGLGLILSAYDEPGT